jgi:hypothetical protein
VFPLSIQRVSLVKTRHIGIAPIKLLASQAHSVNTYKNLRTRVLKHCANIYFNQQCLDKEVIPEYANIATLIDNELAVF